MHRLGPASRSQLAEDAAVLLRYLLWLLFLLILSTLLADLIYLIKQVRPILLLHECLKRLEAFDEVRLEKAALVKALRNHA